MAAAVSCLQLSPKRPSARKSKQTDRQTDRRTDGRTDGRTDRQTDRQTDKQKMQMGVCGWAPRPRSASVVGIDWSDRWAADSTRQVGSRAPAQLVPSKQAG